MVYELIRELIRKIARDKILMGLVILGVLAIFFGGMHSDSKSDTASNAPTDGPTQNDAGQTADHNNLDPSLATDFVKWWLTSAMDYQPSTSEQSHERAFGWMTPQAVGAFRDAFWSPTISEGIKSRHMVAAFQTSNVVAEAQNPDGTVVVAVNGTLVMQNGGQPVSQQVLTDYLVVRQHDGLRVAGIYNRVSPVASN